MLWIITAALLVGWATGLVFHASGFIHILLLTAICVIIVQLVAARRAA
jgi:hypothetical protein